MPLTLKKVGKRLCKNICKIDILYLPQGAVFESDQKIQTVANAAVLIFLATRADSNDKRRFIDDEKSDIIKKLNVFFRDFIAEIQRYGINITREWIRDVIAPGNLGGQKMPANGLPILKWCEMF